MDLSDVLSSDNDSFELLLDEGVDDDEQVVCELEEFPESIEDNEKTEPAEIFVAVELLEKQEAMEEVSDSVSASAEDSTAKMDDPNSFLPIEYEE
jgi:hypothetical protein